MYESLPAYSFSAPTGFEADLAVIHPRRRHHPGKRCGQAADPFPLWGCWDQHTVAARVEPDRRRRRKKKGEEEEMPEQRTLPLHTSASTLPAARHGGQRR